MPAWNDSYSVGVAAMDKQHRKLLGLLEQLGTLTSPNAAADFSTALYELNDYGMVHFAQEEQLLAEHGYDISGQTQSHNEYLTKIAEFSMQAMEGEQDGRGLYDYVKAWWLNHILVDDMAYKLYLNERGVY